MSAATVSPEVFTIHPASPRAASRAGAGAAAAGVRRQRAAEVNQAGVRTLSGPTIARASQARACTGAQARPAAVDERLLLVAMVAIAMVFLVGVGVLVAGFWSVTGSEPAPAGLSDHAVVAPR